MKLKVSQRQYDFYRSGLHLRGLDHVSRVIRIMREFRLDYACAEQILSSLEEGKHDDLFEVVSSSEIPIPAHDNDHREILLIPDDRYEWLSESLRRAVGGGDYYENLMRLTPDERDRIQADYTAKFYPEGATGRDLVLLSQMSAQFFIGVRRLSVPDSSGMIEIKDWIQDQVASGRSLAQVISSLLTLLAGSPDDFQVVNSYIAIADVLYEEASRFIRDIS